MTTQSSHLSKRPFNNDMLVRGVILVLIGLTLVIAPHFMSANSTRDLFVQARIPAWFALVLGAAFMAQHGLHHFKEKRHNATKN